MQIQLKPLELSDTEVLYDFFQEMPASENGKKNGAHGLSKEDFAKWVQKELDFANNRNLPEGYVPGTTFVMYVDGTPVGISNLRHYLNKKLEQDGGHIGTHILPNLFVPLDIQKGTPNYGYFPDAHSSTQIRNPSIFYILS
jgi:predicted acetyltransferase